MIKFRCESCQHKIAVPEDYEGRYVKCPACSAATQVHRDETLAVHVTEGASIALQAAAPVRVAGPSPVSSPRARRAATPRDVPHDDAGPGPNPELTLDLNALADPARPADDDPDDPPQPPATPPAGRKRSQQTHAVDPPDYLPLQIVAVCLVTLGCIALVLWCVSLIAAFSGSDAAAALQVVDRSTLLGAFVAVLVWILLLIGVGLGLLALRDVALNSWHTRESARLLRQMQP